MAASLARRKPNDPDIAPRAFNESIRPQPALGVALHARSRGCRETTQVSQERAQEPAICAETQAGAGRARHVAASLRDRAWSHARGDRALGNGGTRAPGTGEEAARALRDRARPRAEIRGR